MVPLLTHHQQILGGERIPEATPRTRALAHEDPQEELLRLNLQPSIAKLHRQLKIWLVRTELRTRWI